MNKIFDPSDVNIFWENHAQNTIKNNQAGLANLETDPKLAKLKIKLEREKINYFFKDSFNLDKLTFFDIGCGYGEWSFFLRKNFEHIYAYENSPSMCKHMKQIVKENEFKNIKIVKADVGRIHFSDKFNFALLSGILIYLDDIRCNYLLNQLKQAAKHNAQIIIRDGTAMKDEYLINGKYSVALDSKYYAVYRTRDKYISLMRDNGFKLVEDEDMFAKDSELNKWQETRLRIYKFIKSC